MAWALAVAGPPVETALAEAKAAAESFRASEPAMITAITRTTAISNFILQVAKEQIKER